MPPARLLQDASFRAVLISNALERFASTAMAVLLGFQVFAITHDPLDLGWLGLIEAVPGVGLVLYGGHIADRHRRRMIVLTTSGLFSALAFGVAAASIWLPGQVWPLFGTAFLLGVVRAFEDPAAAGLEAQVVPLQAVVRGTAVLATSGRLAMVLGPAAGGLAWGWLGPAGTYGVIGLLFAGGLLALLPVPDSSQPPVVRDEQGTMRRIAEGVRFVFRDELLLGSMLLDLFAVFFGGATALLPAVATDILHVGSTGFGVLRSASAAGALVAAGLAARLLSTGWAERRAGWALLGVIGGFGASIVAFGFSRLLWVSVLALFAAGFCDGVSVVIRRAILRLASPEGMRGRIAAVKGVFVGSSNELGAFESGVAASLLGIAPAIWSGGLVTLAIVAVTAAAFPGLRRLNLLVLGAGRAQPARVVAAAEDISEPVEARP